MQAKLLISQYVDSLVQHIDIYTEDSLRKCRDDEFIDPIEVYTQNATSTKLNDELLLDLADLDLNFDSESIDNISNHAQNVFIGTKSKLKEFDVTANRHNIKDEKLFENLKVTSFLNQEREEMLNELRKLEAETYDFYETIKNGEDFKNLTAIGDKRERQEQLMSQVFANKFAFIVGFELRRSWYGRTSVKTAFKQHLVVLDFYLTRMERQILIELLGFDFEFFCEKQDLTRNQLIRSNSQVHQLNKEYLIADLIKRYLTDLFYKSSDSYVNRIINLKKEELFAVDVLKPLNIDSEFNVDFSGLVFNDVNENEKNLIKPRVKYDFSNVRNLVLALGPKYNDQFFTMANIRLLGIIALNRKYFGNELKEFQLPIIKLDEYLFQSFWNLTRLSLFNCDFEYVSRNAFKSLVNLKTLWIHQPFNCEQINLGGLPNLKWLRLYGCADDMPTISQDENTALEFFELRIDYFYSVNFEEVLARFDLPTLKVFCLSNFALEKFDCASVSKMSKSLRHFKLTSSLKSIKFGNDDQNYQLELESLCLRNMKLKSIDVNLNNKLLNLKSLDLCSNKFERLHADMFKWAKHLTKLDISFNQLTKIDKYAFSGLQNLKSLNLSNNQLVSFDPLVFSFTPKLTQLNLSLNKLTLQSMPPRTYNRRRKSICIACFLPLSTSQRLQEGNFRRSGGDGMFGYLSQLEFLDVSFNKFDNIDRRTFENLEQLKELVLRNSENVNVKSNAFVGLKKLEKVVFFNDEWDKQSLLSKQKDFENNIIKDFVFSV